MFFHMILQYVDPFFKCETLEREREESKTDIDGGASTVDVVSHVTVKEDRGDVAEHAHSTTLPHSLSSLSQSVP